ncbi:ABC transporter ATP-binding protein [Bifidobacterium xylocopae]|uniref:ABC transporter ATP-binding protein n=1 Tax=Bifidobacterium xylocopae TaxID=2493119 RepID=A0A366KGT4_9BIFI|nr:ABC transporter ATP-binding protein [Bifidobacterium xylocopae]RBP99901.1 ABC transporter ATP-binding protein [Bifidobacterium xylocopae]
MSLHIDNLRVQLGDVFVVRSAGLEVGVGQRVGLIGPSGSGKSMITKAVLGMLPPGARASGSIRFFGQELLGLDERAMADLRGSYIGTVFQNPGASLNPVLTVARQVELPLRLHYRLSRAERRERVADMLARVGLTADLAGKYPGQLSGGQQQRVAMATALVTAPKLIVADEPTTALDSITQRQIIDLLVRLVDDTGASLFFITHDFTVLERACRYSYVLDQGRVVEHGPTDRLLAAPREPLTRRLVEAADALTLRAEDSGISEDHRLRPEPFLQPSLHDPRGRGNE